MKTGNGNTTGKSKTSAAAAPAPKLTLLEAIVEKVADKAKFLSDRDVLALATYIKARFGGTAWQPAEGKDVLFNVQFKNEAKEVLRNVTLVVVYANGEYYTRFKAIVTANGLKRTYFPVTLDDAIGILQDTANPYHYTNRINAVSEVQEAAHDEADA